MKISAESSAGKITTDDQNGMELLGNTQPNGRTIFVDGGNSRQVIVRAMFAEEEFWSEVRDGIGRETQEWLDQQVGSTCQIWASRVNGRYRAEYLEEEQHYQDADLIMNSKGDLLEWSPQDWGQKGNIKRICVCTERRVER
jgi:hypothetical protein